MSTHKQSAKENWFRRNCSCLVPRKHTSSTSQHPAAPNAQADVPSTSVSRPQALPASLAQENSRVDIVQPNVITNQPSTVPLAGPTGVGEQIGHALCIGSWRSIQ
jgi:hypothetical protein